MILDFDKLLQTAPVVIVSEIRDRWLSVDIYQYIGDDRELFVLCRQIEMMDQVAIGVGVAEDADAWIDGQLKHKAALIALASGVHANLHHALPDWTAVPVPREMSDGVEHQFSKATSIGYSM